MIKFCFLKHILICMQKTSWRQYAQKGLGIPKSTARGISLSKENLKKQKKLLLTSSALKKIKSRLRCILWL